MTEAQWLTCEDPWEMRSALPTGHARQRRLFACACCRRGWAFLSPESRAELEEAERMADKKVTRREVAPLQAAAEAAYRNGLKTAGWTRHESGLRHAAWAGCRNASSSMIVRTDFVAAQHAMTLMVGAAVGPVPPGSGSDWGSRYQAAEQAENAWQAAVLRDLFGNPFRPVVFEVAWRTAQVCSLAQATDDERILPGGYLDVVRLGVLADALEEAGCTDAAILTHLRSPGPHVRGCWALDLILDKS